MRYIKFTIEEWDEVGENGFVPNIHRNWPNYNPTSGIGLAHDILEHGTRERGGFDQEMAAYGGILFVRDFGRYRTNGILLTNEEWLAGDMARQYDESEYEMKPAPKVYGLTLLEIRELDLFFEGFREASIKNWESEMIDLYPEDEEKINPFADDQIWNTMASWMKYGFARAKRRYKNDRGMANYLFTEITKVAEKWLPKLENFSGTGEEFTLALDIDNGYAEIRVPDRLDYLF